MLSIFSNLIKKYCFCTCVCLLSLTFFLVPIDSKAQSGIGGYSGGGSYTLPTNQREDHSLCAEYRKTSKVVLDSYLQWCNEYRTTTKSEKLEELTEKIEVFGRPVINTRIICNNYKGQGEVDDSCAAALTYINGKLDGDNGEREAFLRAAADVSLAAANVETDPAKKAELQAMSHNQVNKAANWKEPDGTKCFTISGGINIGVCFKNILAWFCLLLVSILIAILDIIIVAFDFSLNFSVLKFNDFAQWTP